MDTPDYLVRATWDHVAGLRKSVGKVVDFGAGDGRFANHGSFKSYIGYEIDAGRCKGAVLPAKARLINKCAFTDVISNADVCIGNPPFVRNQDLPTGWRQHAAKELKERTGVTISGLANAWQYFFLLALASLKSDGLCALVIPYEWVSRPSSRILRDYVTANQWNVSVYRLVDTTFDSVLTTSSITIVDKANRKGSWQYFEETADGRYKRLPSPSGSTAGVLGYLKRTEAASHGGPRAIRGLSPGTQTVLTLTDGERVRAGLRAGADVVRCVTTLRHLPKKATSLDEEAFNTYYVRPGRKCWLIRTDKVPSSRLQAYLDAIPPDAYQTSTCLEREVWWKFRMPPVPSLVSSQSFKGKFPKVVKNTIGARAVGGVTGIYGVTASKSAKVVTTLQSADLRRRVVAHANGLRKIEINQLNTILAEHFGKARRKRG